MQPKTKSRWFSPALNSLSKSIRAMANLRLAEIDLVAGQDVLLLCVLSKPSAPVGDIGNELSVRPSTISKMVDRLTAKGLMRRVRGEGDMRTTRLILTEAGVEKCAQVIEVWARIQRDLLHKETEIDLDTVQNALSHLDGVLRMKLLRLR